MNDETESRTYENLQESEDEEEETVVGDLLPNYDRNVWCNGNCGFRGSDWTDGVMYMCIYCGNCDLCETCYKV